MLENFLRNFQKSCDQRRKNRTYRAKGTVRALAALPEVVQELHHTDTGGEMSMIVFNTRYGFMRWAAYFALCFWRLRLKFNRYGA